MIAGVAQVVVNVPDLEAAEGPLLQAGYRRTFTARGLRNKAAKAPFQSAQRDRLDMVHLAPPRGMAIELTEYAGAPPAGRAAYELVLTHRDSTGSDGFAALASSFTMGSVDGVVDHLEFRAAYPEQTVRFWCDALGFREGERQDGACRLESRAVHPAWRLAMQVVAGNGGDATSVDASGCVLTTVLTTDLRGDLARIQDTGLLRRLAAPWHESVAGRELHVAMIEGPSGELVELLSIPRSGPVKESQ